ncbi:TIGR02611 family protein [Microbacterium pumilum]|uniref:TIGR02611 family protein n=1 Tax=Microbacterium pumilum TaxID=344165 RepID=A0ABN2S0I8_9MICO
MTSESQPGISHPHVESTARAEIAAAERPDQPVRRMLDRMRERVSKHPRLDLGYRIMVGIVGGSLALLGVLLVPLPGPGLLVVFLGLAVLGTEFHRAKRVASWLKRLLDRLWAWLDARRARRAAGNESVKTAA